MDGVCRPFDQHASGYTRSEAIGVVVLQKIKDAKRVYNSILYTKTNCDGYKEQGVTYPSGEMQGKLLTEFYEEINIDPSTVNFIEAHSTGTVVGDPEECRALDKIFCTNRKIPLPVGSVKSNVGHSEASAGMCSIAKIVHAFHNNLIPPNINYTKYRTGISSLEEGRLVVVTEPTPLDGSLICANSFGFGGANAHALFKNFEKIKTNNGAPSDLIPRLVLWSGRTEEAIHSILNDVESRSVDVEYVALLHNIQQEPIATNIYRGFGIYEHQEGEKAIRLRKEVKPYSGVKRPIVWVFNGLGAEWKDIDSLLTIPIFKAAIITCHDILLQKGFNLLQVISSCDNSNLLHSVTAITAIQMGIVDVLKSINMTPDFVVGHSSGELVCAYADGCLTAEQTILCAFTIGLISVMKNKKTKNDALAIIDLGNRKLRSIIPAGIEIAANNGPDSCIIAGSKEIMNKFLEILKKKNIGTKLILNSGIAYHSSYVSHLGPRLLEDLSLIIPEPMKRSAKWISSLSLAKSNAKKYELSSGYYFVSCLLNHIKFSEAIAVLPRKCVTIQIATPEFIKSSISTIIPNGIHFNLLQTNRDGNLVYLLNTLGK